MTYLSMLKNQLLSYTEKQRTSYLFTKFWSEIWVTLINYQDFLKTRKSLVVLATKLEINQWSADNHTVWSHIIKKIYEHCSHSFTQAAKPQQNNCLNSEFTKLSHHDNTGKLHFETDVKKNDCYNCERLSHFTKNCRSSLKNLNHIKINAVKTKKDRASLTVL